jgi:hypothetical protein
MRRGDSRGFEIASGCGAQVANVMIGVGAADFKKKKKKIYVYIYIFIY